MHVIWIDLISGTILGLQSGTKLLGHRFMGKQHVELTLADNYLSLLENEGYVIADYERRKTMIKEQVIALANSIGGQADLDEDLLEEVTSLVEYPHAFLASFEERFLQVPSEALVYTMKGDQKYFPIYDAQNKLLPKFIFISNINPSDTTSLISGNERVVRPRLSDAEFFFKTDRKHSLESYFDKLTNVIYQKDIGTIAYRSEIVEQVAAYIGEQIGADQALCKRASIIWPNAIWQQHLLTSLQIPRVLWVCTMQDSTVKMLMLQMLYLNSTCQDLQATRYQLARFRSL